MERWNGCSVSILGWRAALGERGGGIVVGSGKEKPHIPAGGQGGHPSQTIRQPLHQHNWSYCLVSCAKDLSK